MILGCTHYPLVRPMLQRMLGRGVTLVTPGAGDRPPGRVRARRARPRLARARARATTASSARATPESSARSGPASCSCRWATVEHVDSAPSGRRRRHGGAGDDPQRSYGRAADELRPVTIEPGFVRTATGSALISCGETRVICTASVQESVPRWMAGRGRGWVTAEYGMLPASTGDRKQRDVTKGRPDGRTVEIQRLIGRSLRGVVDFEALGERTVYVDCDVLQADGGTRCASITGGYVALALALPAARGRGQARRAPADRHRSPRSRAGSSTASRCSTSTTPRTRRAEVDANVVMTGDGGLVEVQATAERTPLSRAHLDDLLALARDAASSSCARPRRAAVAGAP